MERQESCFWIEKNCPKCGSKLVSNGRFVWCSFVGDKNSTGMHKPCTFGIDERVRIESI